MRPAVIVATCVLAVLAGAAPRAQQASFGAKGKVKDGAGNPIQGAKATITNTKQQNLTYTRETDKRGDFWFDALLYSPTSNEWSVVVDKEGYVPVKAIVEIRASDRTLVDKGERKLGRENPSVTFPVKAYGEVRLELTLLPADQVPDPAAARAEASPIVGIAAPTQTAPADPYAEGYQRATEGDYQAAVEPLEKAVEYAPDDPDRRVMLAWVLFKLDRSGEALAQAARATAMAPDRVSAQMLLGDLHAAKADYPRAGEAYRKAMEIEPENLNVLERVARIAEESGNPNDAIAANESIVKVAPQQVEAWMSLGDLYYRQRRPDKAEAAYKKVVELDPENAYKTFFNLGAIIENRANLTETDNRKAIEAFRKAVEIKPEYALAHRHLAYALLRAGDVEGAKKGLAQYLALAPDAPDAAEQRDTLKSLGGLPPATKKK